MWVFHGLYPIRQEPHPQSFQDNPSSISGTCSGLKPPERIIYFLSCKRPCGSGQSHAQAFPDASCQQLVLTVTMLGPVERLRISRITLFWFLRIVLPSMPHSVFCLTIGSEQKPGSTFHVLLANSTMPAVCTSLQEAVLSSSLPTHSKDPPSLGTCFR